MHRSILAVSMPYSRAQHLGYGKAQFRYIKISVEFNNNITSRLWAQSLAVMLLFQAEYLGYCPFTLDYLLPTPGRVYRQTIIHPGTLDTE